MVEDFGQFDIIIVGGGSSGAALAGRLTQTGRFKILLLEAGPIGRSYKVTVPLGYGMLFHDPKHNWRFETEAEPQLNGRKLYWPRGKVLGGSSAINAMVYVRGQPHDYHQWGQVAPGWDWPDVAPYFQKMENWRGTPHELRGQDGPVAITDPTAMIHSLTQTYLEAGQALGFALNPDYNAANFEGVSVYQTTTHRGFRVSSAHAYLRKARKSKNLKIVTDAQVTRLVIREGRVQGVQFHHEGQDFVAHARAEVVLSAGALQTPQLMMLSGLGPAPELRSHGIPVLRDMPHVGQHLQDHLGVDFTLMVKLPSLNQTLRPLWGKFKTALRYALLRDGPLAMSLNQGGGFVKSGPDAIVPDLQLYFSPLSYSTAPQGKRPLMSPDPYPAVRLGFNPAKPTSEGRVSLSSADPFRAPRLFGNYLDTEEDRAVMIKGMHLMRQFLATPHFRALVEQELEPGPHARSEAAFWDFIRATAGTVFHQCGTCRMGRDPARSVVDEHLRVHGIAGLRIVDASIFPAIPSGNTNGPAMMLGEKAADIITQALGQ